MSVVELTAADFDRFGLDPAVDRPLTPTVVDGMRRSFARWLGVRPAAVIAFPFASLAPLPHPRRPRPDGRGRLPATVTPAGARHPAWWLDQATSTRDADEPLLAYGVRLALELRDRGLTGPDGEALDALASLGWDADDPAAERRTRCYARGGWDAELSRFTLPALRRTTPSAQPTRSQRRAQASAFLAPRLGLLEVLEARLADRAGAAPPPDRAAPAVGPARRLDELVLPSPPV